MPAIRDLAEDRLQMAAPCSAGSDGLQDGSRRPHRSPSRTPEATAQEVLNLRVESRNCWGGRKLSRQLANHGGPRLPPSTVNNILRRGGLIDAARSAAATPWQRFEQRGPNELWQMDFKGHFALIKWPPLSSVDRAG